MAFHSHPQHMLITVHAHNMREPFDTSDDVSSQVRELQIRESTGVLKWGSILLAKHARSMPFEEGGIRDLALHGCLI